MKFTLAIDQSTSSTKAMLFNEDAALIARTSVDHKQYYPQPGWVEHDPEEILRNTYKSVALLLEKAKQTLMMWCRLLSPTNGKP